MIEPADESIDLSTPPPPFIICRTIQAVSVPQKVCLMDLTQLDNFVKQLNSMRMCATQGCMGELTPVKVSTFGLGGAVSIKYNYNVCDKQEAHFETSSKSELYNTSFISISVQVAFIVAGCTHTTNYKTLKHALGIDAVQWTTFQSSKCSQLCKRSLIECVKKL